MKIKNFDDLEKLFFHLKLNPFPQQRIRYFKNKQIIFDNNDYYRCADNNLKWADKLLIILIQQTYVTMKLLKSKIENINELQTGLDAWM